MNLKLFCLAILLCFIGFISIPAASWGHGVVGQRFFPETITVEDPFPADEMDLLVPAYIKDSDGKHLSFGFGYQKRLTPNLGLSIEAEYDINNPSDPTEPRTTGFTNPEVTLKYAMLRDPVHEAIVSASLSVALPYGSRDIGAESHTAVAPGLLVGKGLGDLPDSFGFLRPLAIAGKVSLETPLGTTTPDEQTSTLSYGLIVEYSIMYLQSFVKDVGIPKPFSRMFPIIEFSFTTPVNGPENGQTQIFANPGVLWTGKYVELGLETQVPLNDRTGKNVGVVGLVHLFLDDIAPNVFSWTPFHGTLGPSQR